MKSLLSIHYLIWLILSGLFFAAGEFFSKKFALNPRAIMVVYILLMYILGTLALLPAILQKNQLSIVGAIWSVLSLLATVLIGLLIFGERLTVIVIIGIITAVIAVTLLSLN